MFAVCRYTILYWIFVDYSFLSACFGTKFSSDERLRNFPSYFEGKKWWVCKDNRVVIRTALFWPRRLSVAAHTTMGPLT